MLKNAKLVLPLIFSVSVLICMWVVYERRSSISFTVETELSPEAQKKFRSETGEISALQTPGPQPGDINATCFSVTLPFPHMIIQEESTATGCSVSFRLYQPVGYGHVTVQKNVGKLAENNHVLMRLRNPILYEQLTLPALELTKEAYGFKTNDELTYFLQIGDSLVIVSFSQVQELATLHNEEALQKLLTSLTLL